MSDFAQGALWGAFMCVQGFVLVYSWRQMPNDGPKGWLSKQRFAWRVWKDEHRCMACGRVAIRLRFVEGMGGVEQECSRCAPDTEGA